MFNFYSTSSSWGPPWSVCLRFLGWFLLVSTIQPQSSDNTFAEQETTALINERMVYDILKSYRVVPAPIAPVKFSNGSENVCYYVSTPGKDGIASYDCEAGYFCPFSSQKYPCTSGFYCGPNCAQPTLCCEGYYCPHPGTILACPKGFFCGRGTQTPISCSFLASCPEGTGAPKRVGVMWISFLVGMVYCLIYLVHQWLSNVRRMRQFKRIMHVKAVRLSAQTHLDLAATTTTSAAAAAASSASSFSPNVSSLQSKQTPPTLPRSLSSDITSLHVYQLGYQRKPGKTVVFPVTGSFRNGKLCAIMGPSGSGKTTFLQLLSGSLKKTSGHLTLHGQVETTLVKYQKVIGFVPQEDIMLRQLTVVDILMHSASTRLPKHWSGQEKKTKVFEIIEYLGLYNVMNNVIGTEVKRGLSGGQRKRVNIGMELVAEPEILFLDEPTSGLDSSTSAEVCALLKEIAYEKTITVISVIHAPSPEVFEMFDDILLLGNEGHVVYFGERTKAIPYFQNLGFFPFRYTNPSDFLLDILTEKVQNTVHFDWSYKQLFEAWNQFQKQATLHASTSLYSDSSTRYPTSHHHHATSSACFFHASNVHRFFMYHFQCALDYMVDVALEFKTFLNASFFCVQDPVREIPHAMVLFYYCTYRACLQIYRQPMRFLLDQVLYLGCGLFISMASETFDYIGVQPQVICDLTPMALRPFCDRPIDSLRHVGMFVSLGVYFAGIMVGGGTFGDERVVYWRESKAGQPTLPYYLGKVTADLPRMLCAALMFTLALILFWPFRSFLGMIYLVILLLFYSAFGIGYFLSMLVEKNQIQLVSTAFALAWGLLFSGVIPSLEKVKHSGVYDGVYWIWQLSAPRYAVEVLYILEVQARPFIENQQDELQYTYNRKNMVPNLWILLIIGMVWNIIALVAMKLVHRSKMK
ncbi:hypothetical protein HMI54_005288 [Coelomomyces lativittatus]|nr:hypothetical protein HMI56_001734 [Coelomomyces lativittatus]KAJ1517517.1 hypothetical protein HMI54_005288 [Coelomomyces lativittatus]KAJ1518050.1 hypothetical protein HMI55_003556 [Coelomomyces lativittatus]